MSIVKILKVILYKFKFKKKYIQWIAMLQGIDHLNN